jgi:hypothetical protein
MPFLFGIDGMSLHLQMLPPNIAGVFAGRTPEFIEMIQVGPSHKSGSARLWGR